MNDRRVLLVEDDPDGQEVVTRLLRHAHYTVEAALTAEDALVMLDKQRYALAIVDLALPNLSGWELLQIIRARPDATPLPCVAVTAFHSPEVAIKAIAAGFRAYFPKPVDPPSFVDELGRILG